MLMQNQIPIKYTAKKHEQAQQRNLRGWYLRNIRFRKSYFNTTVQLYENQTKELQTANRELEMKAETQNELFRILGHDLKSPFNAILGFAGLLRDEIEVHDPATIKAMATNIFNSAYAAHTLSVNLLDWSMANRGGIEPKPEKLGLAETVGSALEPIAKVASVKKIELKNCVEKGSGVYADETMLMTIIRNLASNSIKFTNKGGHVLVSAKPLGRNVKITVSDDGIGMPPEKVQNLFQPNAFSSSKGTAGEKGTGFGLKVVREYLGLLNGTIEVKSEVGKGTAFTITLPAQPPASSI